MKAIHTTMCNTVIKDDELMHSLLNRKKDSFWRRFDLMSMLKFVDLLKVIFRWDFNWYCRNIVLMAC